MFTLIKAEGGDGSVYVLNNRGERFHVSETLMHEMQAGGSWYEPDVRPAAEVNAMALRFTVDSVANLGTINTPPTNNDLMLVKGDGGSLDDNTLTGNGRAVYAVNSIGQKFHVTADGLDVLTKQNGGTALAIATVTQNAVDSSPIAGTLGASGGALVTTNDPVLDQAVLSAKKIITGSTSDATPAQPLAPAVLVSGPTQESPALPTPVASGSHMFTLIKAEGGDGYV